MILQYVFFFSIFICCPHMSTIIILVNFHYPFLLLYLQPFFLPVPPAWIVDTGSNIIRAIFFFTSTIQKFVLLMTVNFIKNYSL